ncbi:hypothetical protein [Nostoc sp.]
MLIGAYRDNEVSATHPLIQTLEEIQKTGAIAPSRIGFGDTMPFWLRLV